MIKILLTVIAAAATTVLILMLIGAINAGDSRPDNGAARITPEEARSGYEKNRAEIEAKIATSDNYLNYSAEALSKSSTDDNVIFFHADWCVVCEAVEANIIQGGIPENLTIFKADFDEEVHLRQKYGTTQQTSFVQVKTNGEEINMWTLFYADASIDDVIENLN